MTEYFRTEYKIVVLSQGPHYSSDLADLSYDITDGDCVGMFERVGEKELNSDDMGIALRDAGSSEEFFEIEGDFSTCAKCVKSFVGDSCPRCGPPREE